MTPKQIIYPVHATSRLSERHITRQMVRRVLATGERFKAPTIAGAQRWQSRGKVGARTLSVIYVETAITIELVTVTWED